MLSTNPVPAATPVLQQSKVKGLLVITLPNGSLAGTASQMNATAIPIDDPERFEVRFNQEVGEMMQASSVEVEKLMRIRHATELPKGHCIEFAFSNKHSVKDGPSAAVACALMAESIITGDEIDDKVAVTGDITATGEIRPIGGVGAKLRGAARSECSIMGIPKDNQPAAQDVYVIDGVQGITQCQIILMETFDQAWTIAQEDKPEAIQKALKDFEMVCESINRNPKNATHPKVVAKLKEIIEVIPNHESARLLALHGMGKGPKKLSLSGSLDAISKAAKELSSTLKDGSYMKSGGLDDPLWENVGKLSALRNDIDPRTRNYLEAFLKTASFIKDTRNRRQWTPALDQELKAAVAGIRQAERDLENNQQVQEELMNQ